MEKNLDYVLILEKSSSNLSAKKEGNDYFLEGVAAVFGVENSNHRIYEEQEYLPHLDYLQKKIDQNRLVGELDHPKEFDVSLKNISHVIVDLSYDKSNRNVKIKVKLLDTPAGRIAKSLVDAGTFALESQNWDRLSEINIGLLNLMPKGAEKEAITRIGFGL